MDYRKIETKNGLAIIPPLNMSFSDFESKIKKYDESQIKQLQEELKKRSTEVINSIIEQNLNLGNETQQLKAEKKQLEEDNLDLVKRHEENKKKIETMNLMNQQIKKEWSEFKNHLTIDEQKKFMSELVSADNHIVIQLRKIRDLQKQLELSKTVINEIEKSIELAIKNMKEFSKEVKKQYNTDSYIPIDSVIIELKQILQKHKLGVKK